MATTLSEIERAISQLPEEEQLQLVDRVLKRVRMAAHRSNPAKTNPLVAMASDPAIQREIRAIDSAFEKTELDGLVKHS